MFTRGRGVHLGKALEQSAHSIGWNSDAIILDRESKHDIADALLLELGANHDGALFSKLDRVVGEIHQHLLQASRVALERDRNVWLDETQQLKLFAPGWLTQHVHGIVDQLSHVECDGLQ